MKPTADEIRSQLSYDKSTGELWWKVRASGRRMDRPAGTLHKVHGYISIGYKGFIYKASHLAVLIVTGEWPIEVDHHDLVRNNDRWRNLRIATHSQNMQNRRRYRNNKSGFKGVSWHSQHRKWCANIQRDGKARFLGLFATPELAYAAYCEAAQAMHGRFARLQ